MLGQKPGIKWDYVWVNLVAEQKASNEEHLPRYLGLQFGLPHLAPVPSLPSLYLVRPFHRGARPTLPKPS